MGIAIKRIYEKVGEGDGFRILIDRLWPRGISKHDAHIDEWMKEIAPSTRLRKWFDHRPERFEEFKKQYRKELEENPDLFNELREKAEVKGITLLFASRNEEYNHAAALKEFLEQE